MTTDSGPDKVASENARRAFREAGYDEYAAATGVHLLESGRFAGFRDVAVFGLGIEGRDDHGMRLHPWVSLESVERASKKLAETSRPATSPWGRPIQEAAADRPATPWGRLREATP